VTAQKPILVIASAGDDAARALVNQRVRRLIHLVTPAEVPALAWRYYPGRPRESIVKVAGQPLAAEEIGGIVTRLPWIHEQALQHVRATDRAYVAAEMNAFLLAWLSDIPCRVVNRPTPLCLSGPGWRHEQWICAAARLGLRVRPASRSVPALIDQKSEGIALSSVPITIVGQDGFGSANENLNAQARRLARTAGIEVFTAYFDGPDDDAAFVGASLWPDITRDAVVGAVLALFD
jgi:hypothetical protein